MERDRMLHGRQGAQGWMRREGDGWALSAKSLKPGESYALYDEDLGQTLAQGRVDEGGALRLTGSFPEKVFLAGSGVVLWDGDAADYLRCSRLLAEKQRPKMQAPEPEEAPQPSSPNTEEPPEMDDAEPDDPPHILRQPSSQPGVDQLPALRWPAEGESARKAAALYPPIAPFGMLPGWRFFRCPSPIRQAAYSLMGYHAAGDAVDAVAWGLPGTPYRPPVSMPGAQYRPGMGGAGYWVQVRHL